MTRIFQILFLFLVVFFLAPLINKPANAQCFSFTCSTPTCAFCTCTICGGNVFLPAPQPTPLPQPQSTPPPPPPPPPPSCPGSGIPSGGGWGGSCGSPGAQTKLACNGPSHCSVAECTQYSGSLYCWYNSGTCYNDPAACNSVNPPTCRQITCGGDPGAGGVCNYPNSPNVNVGSCTYTCTYPFGPSQQVPGHTISVCQSNNCYDNSCQCYPNNPCPLCPTITCNGNSGAGGTCSYPSSPNVNIPGCTYTCPGSTKKVPGHTISVCQSNNCYNNDCAQCYPDDPNACKTGTTKTAEICDNNGKWVQPTQTCVANANCIAGTATPTPIPQPPCNTGPACGSCSAACSNTNSNTKTCTFTKHSSGVACTPVQTSPCGQIGNLCPDGTGCAQNCPSNFNCVSASCQPSLSIAGNVFVDANKNRLKDGGEVNYTGSITITSTGGTVTTAAGTYTVSQLLSGSYTVSYASLPTGYLLTYPIPPSFTVTVGPSCSVSSSNSASCVSGNIINLNFGITNSTPWIQCIGADCRFEKGFTSKVPSTAADGPYANLRGSGNTPGLIFSGDSSPDFGQGQASQNPYNWVVGGTVYPETFAPTKVGSVIKTSYAFLLAKTQRGNITPTNISSYCGGGGISNCTLSFPAGSHGVYIANGNLKVNGAGFPSNQNYVILVNGDLTISGKISVPLGSGSTAAFSASGNIYIDKNLGEPSASTVTDIEGFYSADKSFIVQGTNDCAIGADLRFNVAGNIVVNAALGGGSFQNLRDLCAGNLQYPSFSVKERPDLILNSPEFLKQPNFTYQEIAP